MNPDFICLRLTNNMGKTIQLVSELEGHVVDMNDGTSKLMGISKSLPPSIELQIHEDADFMYVTIWRENGDYVLGGR